MLPGFTGSIPSLHAAAPLVSADLEYLYDVDLDDYVWEEEGATPTPVPRLSVQSEIFDVVAGEDVSLLCFADNRELCPPVGSGHTGHRRVFEARLILPFLLDFL